ncbi:MAG: PxKF domain-containing protein [Gaiellaceae bacterium]
MRGRKLGKGWLNVREAARVLGVHENTVRNWEARGLLRAARLPGSGYRRFAVEEVERLRAEMDEQAKPRPDISSRAGEGRMFRRRITWVLLAGAAVAAVLLVAGSRHGVGGSPSAASAHYMPVPGGDVGEQLNTLDTYWNTRLTYPTGNFNPAWLRHAAAQAKAIPSGIPAGRQATRRASAHGTSSLSPSSFVALGPAPERMTGCGGCFDYTQTEGRINAMVVDPTTTTPGAITAYAATVGGGVWKTTNCCSASTTWTVTTDDPLIAAISIDTLTIDPNNHNTVYAGTGDLNYGSFSMGSQGILKSTDGGAHWTVLGASVFGPSYGEPAGQFPQYDAVGKVRVDPNNSNNVVAGTKKGVFLSYDGGTNWTGPCTTSSFSSQRQDITGLELSNMGGGVTRILAAVGARGFATTVQYDLGANGANGIYKATMPASGCPSFTSIAGNANGFVFGTAVTGSPYTTGANLNAGSGDPYVSATSGDQLGRIDLGVAPSNPNTIYAQVQSIAPNNNSGCGNTNGCQLGVFASTDGGATWSFMAGSAGGSLRNCAGGNTSSNPGDYPQNWYDQGIAVDPNNPDRLFVDTYDVWLASRTGTAFTDMTCGYNGSAASAHVVHVDQHALAFLPGSSSTLLVGSDGGAFGTTNADAASASPVTRPTFFNMDAGLNTIEFYSGDISGNFATSASPSTAGGAQDNAPSVGSFPGGPAGPVQWQLVTGGDGFYARIDPVGNGTNPRYFVGNNSGGLSRCTSTTCLTSGSSYSSVRGSWTGDTQSFIFPFDLFHGGIPGGDDCAPAGTPGGCGHLIGGTTRVWETVAGGNSTMNSASWYVTNNPSTQNMTKGTLGNRSFINQVKYSPKWSSVAAVGTNDANYWIGFNLGTGTAGQANWVNVTGGNAVLPNRPVLGVALDPSSPAVGTEVGYAALGGFNANTPGQPGHVYQVSCSSSCTSFAWADKSGNLPDIPVDSVIVNPNFPQQVFAGTDFGLYFTNNVNVASPNWQKFTAGLPSAMIWDLQIDRGATALSVWTRGRGAYAWPLPSGPFNRTNQTITFGPLADRPYTAPDFTVSATASSGLPVSFSAGASGACTVTGNTVHIVHYGVCTITASQAGNSDYNPAPDVSQSFNITDSVAPVTTATLTPGLHNGWYASPTLTLTSDDGAGGSGVAQIVYSLDGGASTTYSGPLSGFSTGNHFVQYHAVDVAGNVEATKLIAFKVDADKPNVMVSAPKEGAVYKVGKVVTAKYRCSDKATGSGIDTCVGTVPNGSPIDTSLGQHTFTVTATDKAGNVTTVTRHYSVHYAWNGFFAPIKNEGGGLNLVHAGDLIKLGFGLNGNHGLSILAAGSPSSVQVTCPSGSVFLVSGAHEGTPSGLVYGAGASHYSYGWQTDPAWAGTCRQFSLQLNDGTPAHTAVFEFFA